MGQNRTARFKDIPRSLGVAPACVFTGPARYSSWNFTQNIIKQPVEAVNTVPTKGTNQGDSWHEAISTDLTTAAPTDALSALRNVWLTPGQLVLLLLEMSWSVESNRPPLVCSLIAPVLLLSHKREPRDWCDKVKDNFDNLRNSCLYSFKPRYSNC